MKKLKLKNIFNFIVITVFIGSTFIFNMNTVDAQGGLGASCSGNTCDAGLVCINNYCSSPRGNKTEGQSCSGNECIAGLECRDSVCKKEGAIIGTGGITPLKPDPSTSPQGNTTNSSTNNNNNNNTSGTSTNTGSTVSESGLVKCGTSRDCTICDIFILVRDIFNFALGLLAALAVVSIVIGGLYIVTSAGDSGRAREGYSIITNAVIGLLLVMSSFLFFSFVLVSLGFQSANFSAVIEFRPGEVFNVKCDNASTFNDRGQNGGGQGTLSGEGGGSGNVGSLNVACLDATNLDENISAVMRTISFYEGAADRSGYFRLVGGKMYAQSQNVHPGADNPNLYRTTGLNSDAYGRFQMLSTTWGEWASKAGVPTAKPGTYTVPEGTFSYYNMSPQYQDAAVANILKSKGIKDCQSFKSNSFKCQWASIAGCSQSNPKTTQYPFDATCAKMLEDEKTGNCK